MKNYESLEDKSRLECIDEFLPPTNRYICVMDETYRAVMRSDDFLRAFRRNKPIAVTKGTCVHSVPARDMTHWTFVKND